MYRCSIEGTDKTNQYEELIKVFLPPDEYELKMEFQDNDRDTIVFEYDGNSDELKRKLYYSLAEYTKKAPKWGILTGIRPVKLTGEIFDKLGSIEATKTLMENNYLLHSSKSNLIAEILQYQREKVGLPEESSLSVYSGIPFCPTRCLYCSFTSNQKPSEEIDRYLDALAYETKFAGESAVEQGYKTESIYIGGGTPTTLNEKQLDNFLKNITTYFDVNEAKEFTVEAGRPDTVTAEKLHIMKYYGVDRISINPQTMKDETLALIGRNHSSNDIRNAFRMANDIKCFTVNADLIAGLPGESVEDFKKSLNEVIDMGAGNITIHTLAVKRAAKLKELDENYNYRAESLCEEMLSYASDTLRSCGYRPYYLYRQKHTSGNTENIGYCKDDKLSVYNIRMMEEAQSVLALGAGGISKIYFPAENRLERVANVSNYEIYIERLSEMIERKKHGFFVR